MIEYCHYIKVKSGTKGKKDEWVYIPGCDGGAMAGPHACTCTSIEERVKKLEEYYVPRIKELSQTVAALENFLEQQFPRDGAEPLIIEFDALKAATRETERRIARGEAEATEGCFAQRRKLDRERIERIERGDENDQK